MLQDGIAALLYFVYVMGGLLAISFVIDRMFKGQIYCGICWHFPLGLLWVCAPVLYMVLK